MTGDHDVLDAALGYAAQGWPVIPLHHAVLFGPKKITEAGHAKCSCRRPTCEGQGKHPRTENGLDDASTDPDVIRSWWARWPDANVGLRTGIAFDVLDLDGPDALDLLDALAPPGDIKPIVGPMAITGNGLHIYVEVTGAGNRTAMAGGAGIDWRGRGGYVVAPPSVHHLHGDRYDWGDGLYGLDEPLQPVPVWLADVVHKRTQHVAERPGRPSGAPAGVGGSRYGLRALEGELGRLVVAPEGGRNHALNRSAFALGQLVAGGELDEDAAVTQLVTVALRIGLGDYEIEHTIESGIVKGKRSPRRAEVTQ